MAERDRIELSHGRAVQKADGTTVTYNPARLYGVTVYRESERELAVGHRLGFTAPSKELDVANRDLGSVKRIERDGQFYVRMGSGKSVSFDGNQMRHLDHGYAVTSHSSRSLTARHMLVNIDSNVHPELLQTCKQAYRLLIRNGSRLAAMAVFSDDYLLRWAKGMDGRNAHHFEVIATPSRGLAWAEAKENSEYCLRGNAAWQELVRAYLQEIEQNDGDATVTTRIYNPCNLLIGLYRLRNLTQVMTYPAPRLS